MLTVKDNGVGLDGAPPVLAGKFGLRMARERAAYLGGTLTLNGTPGGGATLTITLPKPLSAA